ncbi:conserved hypothetical protein [Nautilia profundicola AmH]|uniref:Cytochrome c domain-containing protein n=1 Tax=Nautilia profundicola (strain ATCC BAA-1463 / DSM 18972 / AmH) TaxID=598659 RepID=B9L951_NAUPA|nr:c-type cytochrome [Nautilia profundicola]ACM92298.1 conserved hypothetical protein [Nautilia profundicola AmH]
MLIRLSFIFLFSLLFAKNDEWFITNLEYGKMLYNNPRGISCAKCHGSKGQGKIITSFINSKGKKEIIKTYPFKKLTFERLKKALFHQIKIKPIIKRNPESPLKYINIMPKYDYLTDNEIKAILLYLTSKDK